MPYGFTAMMGGGATGTAVAMNSLDANVKDGRRVAARSELEEDGDEACAEWYKGEMGTKGDFPSLHSCTSPPEESPEPLEFNDLPAPPPSLLHQPFHPPAVICSWGCSAPPPPLPSSIGPTTHLPRSAPE